MTNNFVDKCIKTVFRQLGFTNEEIDDVLK